MYENLWFTVNYDLDLKYYCAWHVQFKNIILLTEINVNFCTQNQFQSNKFYVLKNIIPIYVSKYSKKKIN